MLSLIPAFQACRIHKRAKHGHMLQTTATGKPRRKAGSLLLALGLVCLPLGTGCRSGSPTDWVGERVAMTAAWQGQSLQVRSEDASFQEGWRNGYQDGRAQATMPESERQPAEFEAFMNSKREEAMTNWRRGYDSGFLAAANPDNREPEQTEFVPPASEPQNQAARQGSVSSSTRDDQHRSLFGIPGNQNVQLAPPTSQGNGANQLPPAFPSDLTSPPTPPALPTLPALATSPALPTLPSLPTLPTISEAAVAPPIPAGNSDPAFGTEGQSQAPSSFDNANELLESAIRKNMAPVRPSDAPAAIDAGAPDSSVPAAPNGSESDAAPEATRSIIELPLDDDDVAKSLESKVPTIVVSTLENGAKVTASQAAVQTASVTNPSSHLTFGQIPPAYQGRIQLGHVVNNPHVSPMESERKAPEVAEQSPLNVPVPVSLKSVAPFLETNSGEFRATAPIAADAPDMPSRQVKHEVSPVLPPPASGLQYLPKGLPLQKRR